MNIGSQLNTPRHIEDCLTVGFLYTLQEECEAIFGRDILLRDENGVTVLQNLAGSNGYVKALQRTCAKRNTPQVMDFWDSLEWYESDEFDGELTDRIAALFSSEENGGGMCDDDRS